MEFRCLKPEEFEVWTQHCASVFEESAEYFARHFLNDPKADFEGIFVALDQGRIVSTVRVFTRAVYLKGRKIDMGGIGEVSTQKEYRGRGINAKLLQMAVDYMERKELPISMLFTETNHHYARQRWFTVNKRYYRTPLNEVEALDESLRLRPLEEADWPAVRGIHDLFSSGLDGVLVRDDPEYWEKWVKCELKDGWVLEREGRVLAYLALESRKDFTAIREFGQLPDAGVLLPMLAAAAREKGMPDLAMVPVSLMKSEDLGYSESFDIMVRLNRPFYLDSEWIDTDEKLCRAMAQPTWWEVDEY